MWCCPSGMAQALDRRRSALPADQYDPSLGAVPFPALPPHCSFNNTVTRFLDTSGIRTRFDERVQAPDGTQLSVDLYLPPRPGRYPVLLVRTAADNNRAGRQGISLPAAERWKGYAAQGYVVAAGDVRGRGDSDGRFTPFLNEGDDGAATIAWLRSFDECNGKIGLLGSGYGAFCAWAAAVAAGGVDAIASISPFGAVGEGLVHRGGAVRLEWLFWMHLVGGRAVQPANVPDWRNIYSHWPLPCATPLDYSISPPAPNFSFRGAMPKRYSIGSARPTSTCPLERSCTRNGSITGEALKRI